jgi:hypothetical protein
LGSVSQKRRRPFSPLLLGRLAKAHPWSATVLVDELDPGQLQRSSDCLIVGDGQRSLAIADLSTTDGIGTER